jgi:hypothetical protein
LVEEEEMIFGREGGNEWRGEESMSFYVKECRGRERKGKKVMERKQIDR